MVIASITQSLTDWVAAHGVYAVLPSSPSTRCCPPAAS
jgi:hypothetical protein